MNGKKLHINRNLFQETTHSPALVDIVPAEEQGQLTDFCFIANPYYPTPSMMNELMRRIPEAIKAYPSSNPRIARHQLASVLSVKPEWLVLGNGATELITIIEQELLTDLSIPVPTFSEYLEKMNSAVQVHLYSLSPERDYQLDLVDYGHWLNRHGRTAALIINPGNPTGQLIGKEDMLDFLRKMSHLKCILIDESFLDFSGRSASGIMKDVGHFQNVIIIRSMSKHCGVPGLRLGYCYTSNEGFLKKLYHRLPAWNINSIAELFLSMLPKTTAEYWQSVDRVVADTRLLEQQLRRITGLKVYPTGSNFILVRIEWGSTAHDVQLELLENYGVYVRDCTNKTGIDAFHLRVSSHGRVDDKLLIQSLKELSEKYSVVSSGISC